MKKKIFGGIAVLAIAVMAAWNVNLNSPKNDLPDISLANVEALAEESGTAPSCYATVNYSSSLGDSYKKRVKYCGSSCGYVDAHNYSGSC